MLKKNSPILLQFSHVRNITVTPNLVCNWYERWIDILTVSRVSLKMASTSVNKARYKVLRIARHWRFRKNLRFLRKKKIIAMYRIATKLVESFATSKTMRCKSSESKIYTPLVEPFRLILKLLYRSLFHSLFMTTLMEWTSLKKRRKE